MSILLQNLTAIPLEEGEISLPFREMFNVVAASRMMFPLVAGIAMVAIGYLWYKGQPKKAKKPGEAIMVGVYTFVVLAFLPDLFDLLASYEVKNLMYFGSPEIAVLLDMVALVAIFASIALVFILIMVPLYVPNMLVIVAPATTMILVTNLVAEALCVSGNTLEVGAGGPAIWYGIGAAAGVACLVLFCGFESVRDAIRDWISRTITFTDDILSPEQGSMPRITEKGAEGGIPQDRGQSKARKGYLGIVAVTQGPPVDVTAPIAPPPGGIHLDPSKVPLPSWLVSFFKRPIWPEVVGVELIYDRNAFHVGFFMRARARAKAQRKADVVAARLIGDFPGLDCHADVRPINKALLSQPMPLHEMRLPKPPYKPLGIVDKFCQVAVDIKVPLKLYIVYSEARRGAEWQFRMLAEDTNAAMFEATNAKADLPVTRAEVDNMQATWGLGNLDRAYQVRLYLGAELASEGDATKLRSAIEGMRQQLANLGGRVATVRGASKSAWKRLVLLRKPPRRFTMAKAAGCDFPASLTIPRGWAFPGEQFKPRYCLTPETLSEAVFGRRVNYGRRTEQYCSSPIEHFTLHADIVGQPGVGKTYLIGLLQREIKAKSPDTGILTINLAKEDQAGLYVVDPGCTYDATSPEFEIPYCVDLGLEGPQRFQFLEEAARHLALALGLGGEDWDLPWKKIYEVLAEDFPRDIRTLFARLSAKLNELKYGKEDHQTIVTTVLTRIESLLKNPQFARATRVLAPGRFPAWLQAWLDGKATFLDFNRCREEEQTFYSFCIFHHVRAVTAQTPPGAGARLRGTIFFDEAHRIMGRASIVPREGVESARERAVELMFRKMLAEFRSRGIGFVIADQSATHVIPAATRIPQLQVIFRVDEDTLHELNLPPVEIAIVQQLKPRQALVIDRATPQRYVMETLDYVIPTHPPTSPTRESKTEAGIPDNATFPEQVPWEIFDNIAREGPASVPGATASDVQATLRQRARELVAQGQVEHAFRRIIFLWFNVLFEALGDTRVPADASVVADLVRAILGVAGRNGLEFGPLVTAVQVLVQHMDEIGNRVETRALRPDDVALYDQTLDHFFTTLKPYLVESSVAGLSSPVPPVSPTVAANGIGNGVISSCSGDMDLIPGEAEVLQNFRMVKPEWVAGTRVPQWQERIHCLIERGKARTAFLLGFFVWNNLFHILPGGEALPLGADFVVLGENALRYSRWILQSGQAETVRGVCRNVRDVSEEVTGEHWKDTPETARLVKSTLNSLQATWRMLRRQGNTGNVEETPIEIGSP